MDGTQGDGSFKDGIAHGTNSGISPLEY
jgi:hypothetical protein